MMNEFRVELFIDSGVENIEFSNFSQKNMEQWKKDMEVRALSEYYNQKVKISNKKIDF